ncbi:GroES-like protein [Lichtheimia hyalospora FSU 10163]|nr:GroES-like protein [Lichtheimia hyalospora FSU 10163]
MAPTLNKQVIFSKIPTTYPVAGEHMTINDSTIDLDAPLGEGEILLKQLVLSVDPYMRGCMRDPSIQSFFPAFPLGKPMAGDSMGVCLKSNNPRFKEGDYVYGITGHGVFENYVVVPAAETEFYIVRNEPKTNGLPITNYVGVLAMPGMTAYVMFMIPRRVHKF